MKSNQQLFNWALKNGEYISIDQFKSGEGIRCGCVCPECGEALVSNISSKQRWSLKRKFTNHFSHKNENSICSGGHGETKLHLFAKKVIEENNSLIVPFSGEKSKQLLYTRAVSEPAFPIEKYKQKKPDILLYGDSDILAAIEIVVTSPVSEEKKILYKEVQLKSLSIDLSFYHNQDLRTYRDRIKSDILIGISRKEWIWTDEKVVEQEELAEVDKEENPSFETKNASSGINPVGVIIAAAVGYVFRKPILNFIKKVLKV